MLIKNDEHIDVADCPDLLQLAQEVHNTKKAKVLTRGSEELAILMPAKGARAKRVRGRVLTANDALWKLVGSATDAEPSDASKKHEYLAQRTL